MQVVAVFVFGKDLHAVIPVAGENLPAYAGRQALVQEFVGDGPADAVAVPVLAGHGIAVVAEEEGLEVDVQVCQKIPVPSEDGLVVRAALHRDLVGLEGIARLDGEFAPEGGVPQGYGGIDAERRIGLVDLLHQGLHALPVQTGRVERLVLVAPVKKESHVIARTEKFEPRCRFRLERAVLTLAADETRTGVLAQGPQRAVFPGRSVFGQAAETGEGDEHKVEQARAVEVGPQVDGPHRKPLAAAGCGDGVAEVHGIDDVEGAQAVGFSPAYLLHADDEVQIPGVQGHIGLAQFGRHDVFLGVPAPGHGKVGIHMAADVAPYPGVLVDIGFEPEALGRGQGGRLVGRLTVGRLQTAGQFQPVRHEGPVPVRSGKGGEEQQGGSQQHGRGTEADRAAQAHAFGCGAGKTGKGHGGRSDGKGCGEGLPGRGTGKGRGGPSRKDGASAAGRCARNRRRSGRRHSAGWTSR